MAIKLRLLSAAMSLKIFPGRWQNINSPPPLSRAHVVFPSPHSLYPSTPNLIGRGNIGLSSGSECDAKPAKSKTNGNAPSPRESPRASFNFSGGGRGSDSGVIDFYFRFLD